MEATQGTLSIHSENIFPIIKKFLYSDEEVFLRELVSNAVDAIQKVRTLHRKGQFKGELGDIAVQVKIDEEGKQLIISDNGIGMTADEVEKYINQIAFSSAEEFLEKYKDDGSQIIGHFGLGFYSAFMVANKVEIQTLSWQEGAEPVHWSCEGSTEFSMDKGTREERGTDIILHITEDAEEYLKAYRIREVLKKYGRFLPVPVKFEDQQINNPEPAWVKAPADLTDEDYKTFYKELYPAAGDPLFWIHLNVDYPFTLKGILYFPQLLSTLDPERNKIQLYQNQVFVTENVEDVVPDYLALLQGVIDSPDIPLNVSRSYLQTDAAVRKISQHISKKVAGKLRELFREDREAFEKKWDSIAVFVKYGMMRDHNFYDKARQFALLKTVDDQYFTMDEYQSRVSENQTDKAGRQVWLYATDKEAMDSYIRAAQKRELDVLLFNEVLDVNFVQFLETKLEKTDLKRVDADSLDKLVDKGVEKASKLNEEEEKVLKEVFEKVIGKEMVAVQTEALGEEDAPVSVVRPEAQRRMSDMASMGMMGKTQLPDLYNVVVNTGHPLSKRLVMLEQGSKEQTDLALHLYDLALLSQQMLKGSRLTDFVERNLEFIRN